MTDCASPSSHFQYGFYHNHSNIENIEKLKHDSSLPQSSFMYYQSQQSSQMNNPIKSGIPTYPLPPTQTPLVFYQDHVNSDLNHGYYPYQSNENLPEIESLMRTINEDPDFFHNGSSSFPSSVLQQSLHGRSQDEYTSSQGSPYMDFFQQSPMSATSPCVGLASFNEFSVAQTIPNVNLMKSSDHTRFSENQEQYQHQYAFCDQPTPVTVPPLIISPTEAIGTITSKDHTIRKLLQTKKKRIPAVPCHTNSVCTTCQTRTTSLWRRNHLGEIECNACNLYFRKNNCKRPTSLRKDEIMKRKRRPRVSRSPLSQSSNYTV